MKRFWQRASAVACAGGWRVELDGRPMRLPPMRLPGGLALEVPHAALARAIAEEWQAVAAELSWDALPLTSLAGSAQHRVAPDLAATVAALARYGGSDCLCYRAEHPPELAVRQHQAWQKWLDWAAARHGARLRVTHGVVPLRQPEDSLAALAVALGGLDAWQLAGLGVLVPIYGSLILGLAVAERALGAEDAYRLSIVDELFQEQAWGQDDEAGKRRLRLQKEVAEAGRYLSLVTDGPFQ